MKTFDEVNTDVNVSYNKLKQVAEKIIYDSTMEVSTIIEKVHEKSEKLNDTELCIYMLQLSCLNYELGSYMEHANLRSECAVAIEKENQARAFTAATGSNEVKRNQATLDTLNESAVSLLYEMVARSLKVKLDESHRVVDVLKSIQIARNAKAKQDNLTQARVDEEVFD